MKSVNGCFANFIRVLIILLNICFLIIGIALVVLTCLLKWSNVFSSLFNAKDLQTAINLTAIDAVAIALIAIGAFAIVLSIIGLIGSICLNKVFLILYEIIIIILFLAHAAALIFLLVKAPSVEVALKEGLNTTVTNINNPQQSGQNQTDFCRVNYHSLKNFSTFFSLYI